MSVTPVHYYIWYRVNGDPERVRVAIADMMDDVRGSTGVAGRLLQRREQPDTWMEVYEGVVDPAGFERELNAASLRHDLARFLPAANRHVEAFVAIG